MNVAVLGCGPAGMMVAHACARSGVDFDIYSKEVKPSVIGGAQYLHRAIPGLTGDLPDGVIEVIKMGEPGVYALKVYDNPHAETSWNTFPEGYLYVWNLRQAYELLWRSYGGGVRHMEIDEEWRWMLDSYDAVFSTIPRRAICVNPAHKFEEQGVWIQTGDNPYVPDDTMIYNGLSEYFWYRASSLFGSTSIEFPANTRIQDARFIVKPLRTDCDCWHGEPLFHFGRYGQWKKAVLVDHAFLQAYEMIGVLQ